MEDIILWPDKYPNLDSYLYLKLQELLEKYEPDFSRINRYLNHLKDHYKHGFNYHRRDLTTYFIHLSHETNFRIYSVVNDNIFKIDNRPMYNLKAFYRFVKFLELVVKYKDHKILNHNEDVVSSAEKLLPVIRETLADITNYYLSENISLDYFMFLNLENPFIQASIEHLPVTPGTFKLFALNPPEINQELKETFSKRGLFGYSMAPINSSSTCRCGCI